MDSATCSVVDLGRHRHAGHRWRRDVDSGQSLLAGLVMRKSLRLIAGTFLAGILGFALALGVPGIGVEQQALALVGCNNSIDCQPANIPMLVESGILAPTTGTTVGGGTAGTIVATSPAGAAAFGAVVRNFVGTILSGWGVIQKFAPALESSGVLGTKGLSGQSLKPSAQTNLDPSKTEKGTRCNSRDRLRSEIAFEDFTIGECDTNAVIDYYYSQKRFVELGSYTVSNFVRSLQGTTITLSFAVVTKGV